MKQLKVSVMITMLVAALALPVTLSLGTTDFAKKEKKSCTTCHVKVGTKDLNDVGKCYQTNNHSLEGCEPKENQK